MRSQNTAENDLCSGQARECNDSLPHMCALFYEKTWTQSSSFQTETFIWTWCCDSSLAKSNQALFFLSLPGIVSLISLVILSYDRYRTLTVYNKHGPDYRKPLLAVGGSWLYSLIWTVPPLLGWSSYGLEGAGTSCSVSWTQRTAQSHAYIICLFIFCLGIPVLIMVYCYGRLLYAVKQVRNRGIDTAQWTL